MAHLFEKHRWRKVLEFFPRGCYYTEVGARKAVRHVRGVANLGAESFQGLLHSGGVVTFHYRAVLTEGFRDAYRRRFLDYESVGLVSQAQDGNLGVLDPVQALKYSLRELFRMIGVYLISRSAQ